MADDLKRVVVWKSLFIEGAEYCTLWQTGDGWLLQGTFAGALQDQRPMLANYRIHCDEKWLTRRVEIERTVGSDVKTLSLAVEKDGAWHSSGRELRDVHGCADIDLALTPATNTLPIRRLDLRVGSSEAVTAAWVRFPELSVQVLSQRYTRMSKDNYRYESDTGFSAEIVVDDLGLVIHYPGGWERVAVL